MVKRIFQRLQCGFTLGWRQFAFPHGDAMPAHFGESALLLLITFTVTVYFRPPKVLPGLGYVTFGTVVPVPKTAVYEYACTVFTQNDVGMTGQAWMVDAIPEPFGEKIFAHDKFGPCILRADSGHYLATFIF